MTAPAAPSARTCGSTPQFGHFSCFALKRTDIIPFVSTPNAVPNGYGPANLQSAYNLPSASAGAGQTVAVVDAFDDPNAEADLAVYRAQFGLPACTTANGCFRKVNQSGQAAPLPSGDTGWAGEESLDLDAVSAICPNCHLLLVEATDDSTNLFVAVNEAVALGAGYVSLSWGGSEGSIESSFDSAYLNHPGVVITASTGDSGYAGGTAYPAASPDVVAVGGTSLSTAANTRGWSETAWSGAGSGCSAYEAAPAYQTGVTTCTSRGVADVSADADPRTGIAVYQTYGGAGWTVYGGTSLASPLIAATYALAGPRPAGDNPVADPYAHATQLNDVTTGSTGLVCGLLFLCNARVGWDGPTGLGTPNGVGAFRGLSTVTVTGPGDQTTFVSTPVGLSFFASDSDGSASLTYSATNLPPGLSINPATGLISGTPTTVGQYAVTFTATDPSGSSASAGFTWAIINPGVFTPLTPVRLLDTRNGAGTPVAIGASVRGSGHRARWRAGVRGLGGGVERDGDRSGRVRLHHRLPRRLGPAGDVESELRRRPDGAEPGRGGRSARTGWSTCSTARAARCN